MWCVDAPAFCGARYFRRVALSAVLRSDDQGATWKRTDLSIKLGGNADGRGEGERLHRRQDLAIKESFP